LKDTDKEESFDTAQDESADSEGEEEDEDGDGAKAKMVNF
jgi:hypothetical protein